MNQADRTNLALAPELDIKAAAPLAEGLIALRGNHLCVDASAVTRLGAQCLQVVLSAAATWRADGFELDLHEPSPAFADAVSTAGLRIEDLCARNQ